MKDSFACGEEDILKTTPKAIDNLKASVFKNMGATSNVSSNVRVKKLDNSFSASTNENSSNPISKPSYVNYGGLAKDGFVDVNNKSASSFVLVVASVIALLVIAFVVAYIVFMGFKL